LTDGTSPRRYLTFIISKQENQDIEDWQQTVGTVRPLQNAPFCPISALGSNFNPQNTQCIPVVKIFTCLELEQN